MREEFETAVAWVDCCFEPRRNETVNFFEVSIRVLGGLLGAQTSACE